MPRFVGGHTDGSEGGPIVDIRGETQLFSPRIVMVGKEALAYLDGDIVDPISSKYCTSGGGSGEAPGGGDLAVAGEG